jgi:hypothetical protein
MALVEDIQRVLKIECPPTDVSNGIIDVGVHFVDYGVEVFGKEKLADVSESRGSEEGLLR